jgi:hypothetical protein
MPSMRAIVGAAIGALLGALIWAAVAYFTNFEVGWIAWGVGVLAGLGAKLGADGQGGKELGVAAAGIALAGIALGKFAAVSIAVSGALSEGVPEEVLISYVADAVAEESLAQGGELAWPVRETEVPDRKEHYPAGIWSEAERRWGETPEEERQAFRAGIDAGFREHAGEMRTAGFLHSFSPMDLLFAFLAVSSAFKIAQGAPLRGT